MGRFPSTYQYRKGIPGYREHSLRALLFVEPFAFSSVYLHLIVFLPKPRTVLFQSVLHSVLCVSIRYIDISDRQMSGVGLGIIKWGQNYKALTVLYWSRPLSFVKRGTSSAEALEVMSKKPHSCVSLFPSMSRPPTSCPVCPSYLLCSFAESFMLSLFICRRYLLSPFTFCRSLLCPSFCLSSILIFFC